MSTGFSVPSSGDTQRSLVRLVSSRSSHPEETGIEAGRRAGRQAVPPGKWQEVEGLGGRQVGSEPQPCPFLAV